MSDSDHEMAPLDEHLAALFTAERSRAAAPPGSKERVFERVAMTIRGSGGDGGGGSQARSSLPQVSQMAGWPLLAAFVVGGAVGAGALAAVRPPRVVYVDRPVPTAVAPPAPTPELAVGLPATTIASEASAAEASREPTAASSSSGSSAARDAALAREREILDVARTALGRGDGAHALEAVDRHTKEFPRGQMTEEREAIGVQALARLGRAEEAKARGERFRRRYPNSVLGPVIDAALGNLK